MESLELTLTRSRVALLICFAASIILLIPAHQFVLGGLFLVAFIVQTHYPTYGLDFLWRKGF